MPDKPASAAKPRSLIERDLAHVWHPCSQMKDYETFKPLPIVRAEGSYVELSDGKRVFDAISSWWCKSLGHGHPAIKQAVLDQMEQFEHVMLVNTTNETIVELTERLTGLMPGLTRALYAGDGSCAVEAALKMSLHSRLITGQNQRRKFMALANGYHGETSLTLSVSDLGLYRKPYECILLDVPFLQPLPYVSGEDDPKWSDISGEWLALEQQLDQYSSELTAFILEPVLQGAGGMKIYSPDLLRRISQWCRANDVHLIADEIMTGFGRTGKMLACEHAGVTPDLVCLSKGLTSGWLPMSALLTSERLFQLFYDDYQTGKSFLHSHTYSGNVLAAAAALATLKIMDQEQIPRQVTDRSQALRQRFESVAKNTGLLTNIRSIGFMVSGDLIGPSNQRLGYQVYQEATKLGALLRPLGNSLYWLPPLNTLDGDLDFLAEVTEKAIMQTCINSNLR